MTDRPILFSGPMVRGLLDDRKTQTRRFLKLDGVLDFERGADGVWRFRTADGIVSVRCPYGVPGDRLWVRESWTATFWTPENIDGPPREFWATPRAERTKDLCSDRYYRASEEIKEPYLRFAPEGQWTPSIHMPRWASRITLEITGVRVERLNDCSKTDAAAEGLFQLPATGRYVVAKGDQYFGAASLDPREVYAWLWESINGAGSWAKNPWVWVVEFKRAEAAHG